MAMMQESKPKVIVPLAQKKHMTLPEVVKHLGDIAAEWGGTTESIRTFDKNGRIREMSVTIKFTAV